MDRAQIPLPVLEAAIGVVLLTALALLLVTGVPSQDTADPQLEAYAQDVATLLGNEPPRHANETRLSEIAASADAFEREQAALQRRIERLLTANLFYQVQTPHGRIGHRLPQSVRTGTATVPTANGPVTIRVWYG